MFTSPSPPQLKPHGDVIRKTELSPSSFFPFLYFFFFFSCPSLLALFLFDEVVGVQREAARLRYRPSTKHHGKSKLWLVWGEGRQVMCACVCMLWLLPVHDYTQRSVIIPKLIKTLKVKKVELNPFPDTLPHIRSLPPVPSPLSCQTSGGPTNQWLNSAFACVAKLPRLPEGETTRGYDVKEERPDWTMCQTMLYIFSLDLLNTRLGWGIGDIFMFLLPHGWHVSKIPVCAYVCGVVVVGVYAHSQWRCHPPKLSSDPHRHMSTQQLANPTQPKHTCIHTHPQHIKLRSSTQWLFPAIKGGFKWNPKLRRTT